MNTQDISQKKYSKEISNIHEAETSLADKFESLFKLFYRTVKSITANEDILYRNFFARFRFLLTKLDLTANQKKELDAFRRFVREKKPDLFSDVSLEKSMLILDCLIAIQGKEAIDASPLSVLYFQSFYPIKDLSKARNLKVLISESGNVQNNNGSSFFLLKGFELENLEGEITIFINNFEHTDFSYLHSLVKPNTIMYFQNLEEGQKSEFKTTYNSLITIEPDFLIDATAIGSCFGSKGANSDVYFLSKLVKNLPGAAALKGSLVGHFLDEKVRAAENNDSEVSNDDIFKAGQKNNSLKAAKLGKNEMEEIKQSINGEHLDNIDDLVKKEKDKSLWIEPTFFSKYYGLQGRLDLLTIENEQKNVIELKSGQAPNPTYFDAWKNHSTQVVCYALLLDGTYGVDREGTSAVFYSKNVNNPMPYRYLVSEIKEKQEVLQIRNEIVTKIYNLSQSDFSLFQNIKINGIANLPPFSKGELTKFQNSYDSTKIASQYYQELISFTLRELINAKVGNYLKDEVEKQQNGFAGLWLDTVSSKQQDYSILYDLIIERDQIDEKNGGVVLTISNKLTHSFRKGDLVVLYPSVEGNYNAMVNHILKGAINEIDSESIKISLFNKQTDYSFFEKFENWAIESDLFERNYWSTISSLFNVIESDKTKKELLFGHKEPVTRKTDSYANPKLNENQNKIIGDALNAQDYYLIQGPPGTGKTSTFLVNFVQKSLKSRQEKIVILAFTNKAVGKICESFSEPRDNQVPIEYIRFGGRSVDDDNLFRKKINGDNPDDWKKLIDENRVFVSTVSTFQNNWQLIEEFIKFDTVVIDEASQLTEADVSGIVSLFKRFIMIGDHKQLPAVVTQPEKTCKTKSHYLNTLSITDFRVSLFERLFRNAKKKGWSNSYGQLTSHYRMHEQIAVLIERNYEKLEVGRQEQKLTETCINFDVNHPLFELNSQRITFVETPPESVPKKNTREAKLIAYIVESLINDCNVDPKDIGVIAPFRAQLSMIKECLDSEQFKEVLIDTVERFQGDEKKIILFSTTISKDSQISSIQNLDAEGTDRKLLVSVSRASEQLIIFGNSRALSISEEYQFVINKIKDKGSYFDRKWSELKLLNVDNKVNQ